MEERTVALVREEKLRDGAHRTILSSKQLNTTGFMLEHQQSAFTRNFVTIITDNPPKGRVSFILLSVTNDVYDAFTTT